MSDKMRHIFTSESVTEGHPDKMADQISDAVLDAVAGARSHRPRGLRSAGHHRNLRGRRRNHHQATYVDVPKLAREVIADIGFTDAEMGFDAKTCGVLNYDSEPVARYRHGRGYGRRGRSGPDVRLCLR